VNCQEIAQGRSVDVIEIDGASNTSVDHVREIRENVKFTPFRGQYRVYIIDEVHMLSNSAFNALLKTLEEPPAHVVFVFATTEIHKIPATILSRCQHHNFRRIAQTDIVQQLRAVAEQDQLTIEERSFLALARASEGSMRDALSLLDQAIAFGGKTINHADLEVLLGAVPQELVQGLIRAILAQDSPAALTVLASLQDQGHEWRTYCAEVVEHVRNLLVTAVVPVAAELRGLIEASEEDLEQLATNAGMLTPEQLQELLAIFTQAEDTLRFSTHPRFVMEAAAIRATRLLRQGEANVTSPAQVGSVSPSKSSSARSGAAKVEPAASHTTDRPLSPSRQTVGASTEPVGRPVPASPQRMRDDAGPVSLKRSDRPASKEVAPDPSTDTAPAGGNQPALNWEAVQEEVADSFPNIAPFLEAGRFVGMEGESVTIGFTKQATVARAILQKEDNLRTLATLCERQAGYPVRVRVVELTETDPAGPTMAQARAAKEQGQRLVLFDRARANPTVKQALEIFGAELAEVRTAVQKEGSK
jgi:DNA polymerase-3 subunit gamma/tau